MKIKPISKFLKVFLGDNIAGITLCPFGIYVKDKYLGNLNTALINHEKIHWKQQIELLVIPFYILYLLEFAVKFFIYGGNAYKNLSFEKEAYENDDNLDYLTTRKSFAWVKYIIKK